MAVIKRYTKENGQRRAYYQAQLYFEGTSLKCESFKNKIEAYNWYKKEKEKFLSSSARKDLSFSSCLKQYMKEALPLLQKSTRQAYEFHFRYFMYGPLSNIKMEQFNSRSVYTWIKWLKKHPTANNHGRKTFINELRALSIILNWYRNFIDEDFNVPITKKHRQLCYYKAVPPQRPDYYARPEELKNWLQWLRENRRNPAYWKLAAFMLLTGARVGEACGMLWEAVDLNRGIARVTRRVRWDHKTRKPYLENITKTKSSVRLLLLSSELVSLLRQLKQENKYKSKRFVFIDYKGDLLKYTAIQATFNTGFRALNLPWRSTHILRHSYATMALMATKDLPSVQASLGHSSVKMTERYAKIIALLNRDVAEKTTKAFNLL